MHLKRFLFFVCFLLALRDATATNYYYEIEIFTNPTCTGTPSVSRFLPYMGECYPQSAGELKVTAANATAITVCAFNTPQGTEGCSPDHITGCAAVGYNDCFRLGAQPIATSARAKPVLIDPTASRATHYTVMAWTNNLCSSSPAGKLPGRSPSPNPLGVYPYRTLFSMTDSAGNNPPTGACDQAICGASTVCWVWRTSADAQASVNVCSNGQLAPGGTTCAAATQCSTFTLTGTSCQVPTYQPLVPSGSTARFDLVLPNVNSLSNGPGSTPGNSTSDGFSVYPAATILLLFVVVAVLT